MMKRFFLVPGLVIALYAVTLTGCDFMGSDTPEPQPDGALRYQNYSHYQAERTVAFDDTTLATSVTSRVNLVVDGDTVARAVGIGQATGTLPTQVGRPLSIETHAYPNGNLLAGVEATLEDGMTYVLYTFGYGEDIQPVLLRQPAAEEAPSDELPPLSGEASFRFLHGASTAGAVDVYVNRPAEADSLEQAVSEMDPVLSGVEYQSFTESLTREVSRDPQTEMTNLLRLRVTPAGDTTTVYDEQLGFAPESSQYFVIFDRDTRPDTDSLDIRLGRKSGEAEKVEL